MKLFGSGEWAVLEQLVKGIEDMRCPLPGVDLDVTQIAQGTQRGSITHALCGSVLFSFGTIESQSGLRLRGQLAQGGTYFAVGLGPVRKPIIWGQRVPLGEARTILVAGGGNCFDAVLGRGQIGYAAIAVPEAPFVEFAQSLSPSFQSIKASKIVEMASAGQLLLADTLSKTIAIISGARGRTAEVQPQEVGLDLVTALIAALSTGRALGKPRRSREIVARMEDLISSSELALSIDEICLRLRLPRRALERAFRREFGTSPARYAMMFRLCRAREELSRGRGTVTGVAAKFGFFELGRFAGRYRKTFGEYPSKTLAASKYGLGVVPAARLPWEEDGR